MGNKKSKTTEENDDKGPDKPTTFKQKWNRWRKENCSTKGLMNCCCAVNKDDYDDPPYTKKRVDPEPTVIEPVKPPNPPVTVDPPPGPSVGGASSIKIITFPGLPNFQPWSILRKRKKKKKKKKKKKVELPDERKSGKVENGKRRKRNKRRKKKRPNTRVPPKIKGKRGKKPKLTTGKGRKKPKPTKKIKKRGQKREIRQPKKIKKNNKKKKTKRNK